MQTQDNPNSKPDNATDTPNLGSVPVADTVPDLDLDDPAHPQNRLLSAKKQTELTYESIGDDLALNIYLRQAVDALSKAVPIVEQREGIEGRDHTADPTRDQPDFPDLTGGGD